MARHQLAGIPGHAAGLVVMAIISSIAAGQDAPPGRRAAPAAGPRRKADRHGDPLPPGALVRLGTVQHRQEMPIEQIVYSRDGRLLATDGDDASVRIWDGGDGKFLRRIEVGRGEVRALAFSPDARTLVVASYRLDPDQLAYVVDVAYIEVASGSRIVRGPWPEQDSVSALAIAPDLGLVATATTGGTLRFRDARSGDETGRFLIGRRDIRRIAFAASGSRLAALSHDEGDTGREFRVDIFEPRRKAALRVIPDVKSARNVALSPDGNLLIISDKFMMDCRDVGSGQDLGKGHLLWGEDAAFSADGRLVAAFHWPNVAIHDLVTGETLAKFESPTSRPTAWAFSPDGATVAASGSPTALHLWDVRTGRDRLATGDAHSEPVRCLLFSADGKTVVTGGDDRTVRIWDAASGECRKVLNLAGKPRTLTLSPDGRLLIAGAEDNGWLFTWDLAAGTNKPVILLDRVNSEGYPLAVRFSPGDRTILAAWSDGRLLAGDRESGKLGPGKPVKFLDESPLELIEANRFRSGVSLAGGARLGVVRRERGLRVADLGTGRQVWEFDGATIVAATPDQRTLAVAVQRDDPYYQPESWRVDRESPRRRRAGVDPDAAGASIVLLDGETGKETRRISAPGTTVWGLAFSPDGKTLAVTCGRARGQVRLYAIATGRQVRSFATPPISGPVVAFAPDGSRLATAMADTSVLLWDPRPGP